MKDKEESNLLKLPFNGQSPYLIDKIMLIGYDNIFKERNTPILLPRNSPELLRETMTESINPFPKQDFDIRSTTYETEKSFPNRCATISYGRQTSESSILSKEKRTMTQSEFVLPDYPIILGEIASDYTKNLLENEVIISLIFPTLPKISLKTDIDSNREDNIIFSFNPITNKTKSSVNGFAYVFYETYHSFAYPKVIFFYTEYPYFSAYRDIASKIRNYKSPLEHLLFNIVNFTPSPINSSISLDAFYSGFLLDDQRKTLFPQLSCNPLFNFDLSELFNILPLKMIIEIFFFSFLEHDLIFFSRNLELLNILMYIFSNLNFPCNDSTYYWQILSVSLSNFMNDSISFCGKPCSCIIGINEAYDSSIQTTSKNKDHFVVDIDNKRIEYKYKEDKANKDEVYKNKAILEYLNKAMKSKHSSSYLKRSIAQLYESLRELSERIINKNNTSSRVVDFFKYNAQIESQNKAIQNIFYSFIVKILHLFTESNSVSLTTSCDKGKRLSDGDKKKMFFISLDGNKKELKPEEALVDEKFRQCSKYNQYIVNFNQFQDCIDLFKIPLFITQELIAWLNINKELQLTFCFDLMDKIYYEAHKAHAVDVSLSELNTDIMKEQLIGKKKQKKGKSSAKALKVKMKRLINYYKHYLNLTETERCTLYPSYKLIKENTPHQCTSLSIQKEIELEIINKQILSKDDLLLMSLITVFCLTRETCAQGAFFQMTLFKDNFVSERINLRKYYVLLLNICYRLPKKNPHFLIDNYFLLVNSIRANDMKVIPNEELLMLLNQSDSMIHEIAVEAFDFEKQLTDFKLSLETPERTGLMTMVDELQEKGDKASKKVKGPELVLTMPFSPSKTVNRSNLYSLKKIYSLVNEMIENYYQSLDNDNSYDINELKNIVLNLVFYIQILTWKTDDQKRQLTQLMLSILIYVNSKGDAALDRKTPFVLQLK